jgi:hypothetical protein
MLPVSLIDTTAITFSMITHAWSLVTLSSSVLAASMLIGSYLLV